MIVRHSACSQKPCEFPCPPIYDPYCIGPPNSDDPVDFVTVTSDCDVDRYNCNKDPGMFDFGCRFFGIISICESSHESHVNVILIHFVHLSQLATHYVVKYKGDCEEMDTQNGNE